MIEKIYNWEYINNLSKLKKLLQEGYNVFDCIINLSNQGLTDADFQSISQYKYIVNWEFDCSSNKLTSLIWCPEVVRDHFYCEKNKLKTLVGGVKIIKWDFRCYNNQLTSLIWAPKEITGHIYFVDNPLLQLKKLKNWIFKLWDDIFVWDCDKNTIDIVSNFNLSDNIPKSPDKVKEYFNAFNNFIGSTTKLEKDTLNNNIKINWKNFNRKFLKI